MTTQNEAPVTKTWSVLVLDLFNYMAGEGGEYTVTGFQRPEEAIEYARRRLRSSVEEMRPSAADAEGIRNQWFMFGEDCIAIGTGYNGLAELDYFIANPASPEEIDWTSLEPDLKIRELLCGIARNAKESPCQ
jgi:hypothetical protein